jgi:hypothetical protein
MNMRTASTVVLTIIGILMVMACGLIGVEIPGQFAEYSVEPEDAWGTLVYAVILGVAAFAFLGAAAVTIRPRMRRLAAWVLSCSLTLIALGLAAAVIVYRGSTSGGYSDPAGKFVVLLLLALPFGPALASYLSRQRSGSPP